MIYDMCVYIAFRYTICIHLYYKRSFAFLEIPYCLKLVLNGVYSAKRAFSRALYACDGHALEASVNHEPTTCCSVPKDVWCVPEAGCMSLKHLCI